MESAEWSGPWIAKRLAEHEEVLAARLLRPQVVEVSRKQYATVLIGTTSTPRLAANVVAPLLSTTAPVSFIVNVSKESFIAGDALALAARNGVALGGVGDLNRALRLPDVSQYQDREVAYVERALNQHSRVTGFQRLDDKRYLLERANLPDISCVFLSEYELTSDHVRTAFARYGQCRLLVLTNPNCHPSASSRDVAEELGYHTLTWREFLGALHKP